MLLLSMSYKLLSMYLGCRFYPFMYVEFFRILLERSGLHLFPCTINCQTRVKGCFENIDHTILMHILQENIHDNRFLRLIEGALKAGYCEEWTYHPSLSGSPQGGIVTLPTKLPTFW